MAKTWKPKDVKSAAAIKAFTKAMRALTSNKGRQRFSNGPGGGHGGKR